MSRVIQSEQQKKGKQIPQTERKKAQGAKNVCGKSNKMYK